MIALAVWSLFALTALLVLWLAFRGRELDRVPVEELSQHLRPLDFEAFLNLVDPAEEEFLRREVSPADFAEIRKERMRAVLEYMAAARHNAAVLLRLGEAAQRSQDEALVRAGEQMVAGALTFRTNAVLLTLKIELGIFTGLPVSLAPLRERYAALNRGFRAGACFLPELNTN